LLDIFRITLG